MTGIGALVTKVVGNYHNDKDMLIQVLLDLQSGLGWLPQEVLAEVSRQLRVPVTRVYQVASYYKAFSFAPKGRHTIRVYTGTACYVKGIKEVIVRISNAFGVHEGETSTDRRFSLEGVRCLGACGLAPVMVVGKDTHGAVSADKVIDILQTYA